MIGGQGFMVSAYSEMRCCRIVLIDFMATEDAMRAMYDVDPRCPAFVPLLELLARRPSRSLPASRSGRRSAAVNPQMSSVWGAAANAQQFIIQGELASEEAFTTAGEQIRTLIAVKSETVAASTVGDTPPAEGASASRLDPRHG